MFSYEGVNFRFDSSPTFVGGVFLAQPLGSHTLSLATRPHVIRHNTHGYMTALKTAVPQKSFSHVDTSFDSRPENLRRPKHAQQLYNNAEDIAPKCTSV